MRTILGVLVGAVLVIGCAGTAGTSASAAASAAASPSGAFGGTVEYQMDGGPASTTIDATAEGSTLSGTAVTTFKGTTHTVRIGCAAQKSGGWVVGGTVEKTTVHGESPGAWSAVIVKDGTPQRIAIWLSADRSEASDCDAFVASLDPAEFGDADLAPIESGSLVPPPAPAS